MSSGMPELGSKISLISKADIRYEGELYTVDPNECTIALSNVRSFGTEEREAQCPVPAQNQIYDFILFRGSDIKDIRVVQGQPMPPNDPAIVQVQQHQISHPPPSAAPGYPGLGQPAHAYSHHMGAAPGSHLMGGAASHHVHQSAVGGYNPMSGMTFTSHKPSPMPSHGGGAPPPGVHHEPPPPRPAPNQNSLPSAQSGGGGSSDLIGSLSRSSTPAPRKSPVPLDLGAPGSSRHGLGLGSRAVQRPQSRQSRSRERLNSHSALSSGGSQQVGSGGGAPTTLTYRDRNDFYDRNEMRHDYHHRSGGGGGDYRHRGERDHYRGSGQRGGGDYRDNYRHQGGGRGGGGWHNSSGGGGHHGNSSHQAVRSHSGGRRQARPRSRGPGFGAGAGAGGGAYGAGGKGGQYPGGKAGALKFESDYDFDKANSEFNEMLSKLNETKLDDGGAPVVLNGTGPADSGTTPAGAGLNGSAETGPDGAGKKEDGSETGGGEGVDPEDDKFYDKTKSFFDKISCEAVERSKGAFQRTDWRQERKMNSETFGVAATRRGGGYRGRGGFYYGGGGRGYNHHRNHYNQGRNNRGGYGPRLNNHGGGQQRQGGQNNSGGGGAAFKESANGALATGVKTAAQVVAGTPAPIAAEAK